MISICIPTWNRDDLTIKSFEQVLEDDRISEIVIVDDASDWGYYQSLKFKLERLNSPKIKLYRNEKNLDCYFNKREAIGKATNEWVVILDSDNVIDKSYIDAIFDSVGASDTSSFNSKTIYSPEFARPHFDFREMSGRLINRETVHTFVDIRPFHWLINAMNYFVNRDFYLACWDENIDPHTSDTIYQNYNMIRNGGSIYVVPGCQYDHLVHDGSHYKANVHKTVNIFGELMQKLTEMR